MPSKRAFRTRLVAIHKKYKSWRKVARLPEFAEIGIRHGTLSTIAKTGYFPKKWLGSLNIVSEKCLSTRARNARLKKKFNARKWDSVSQFLTAVDHGEAEIPRKEAV